MVRPVVEYGDVVYDNSPAYIAQMLERVQRKASLICTGAYRHTETQTLLRDLAWKTLETRRKEHKLIVFYKIFHGIYPSYLYALLPPVNNPRYRLRNSSEFKLPHARLNSSINSFFPSTAKVWNNIPPPIKESSSVPVFKRLMFGKPEPANHYNMLCSGKKGIWLTRLRLGLSPLNFQRFTYNLTNDPFCPNCENTDETIEHFMLSCPAYTTARISLFNSLHDIGIDTTNKALTINTILHGMQITHV